MSLTTEISLLIFEGHGLIQIDKNSGSRVGCFPGRAHHDLDFFEDGSIGVLTRKIKIIPEINETERCGSRIPNSVAKSRPGTPLTWRTRVLTYAVSRMQDLLLPLLHLAVTATKLCPDPAACEAVIAENLLLKQQLIVLRRSQPACAEPQSGRSAPMRIRGAFSETSGTDSQGPRIGLRPRHVADLAIRRWCAASTALFSSSARPKKPGPIGARAESLIRAIVEHQIRAISSIRVPAGLRASSRPRRSGSTSTRTSCTAMLAKRYRPAPCGTGPSWLSFVGSHWTDSLWSVDLLRCESIVLQSYWVLVVM